MSKKLLALLLIVPMLICCKGNANNDGPEKEKDPLEGEAYAKAAPMIKSGGTYLVTNENVEKFVTEVNYPDKDWSFTKIFDYYGGFDGKKNASGEYNFSWSHTPDSDKPNFYSIRWIADLDAGAMVLHLEDNTGWSADTDIKAGSCYVDIKNMLPNAEYTYKVTSSTGKIMAEGNFFTTGHVHQVFFKSNCRNARDLGGWVTADGTKRIKYRKVYRGGRMNDPWEVLLSKVGKKEVLDEGIGAELELRGSDDYMTVPAVDELDHCHPCIEEGGKVMLGVTKPSAKNCMKWLVFDESSPWTAEQKAPFLQESGKPDKTKIDEWLKDHTPSDQEFADFQTAYKAKTKECFLFMLNSVKAGKGMYFHCSLGRDRTGTMQILTMGILGVREGDIGKEYELTYFAPVGYSVSSSDKSTNPIPVFKNDRTHWVYSDVVPYFWSLSTDGTFYDGVRNYLLLTGVTQAQIDEFRSLMLEDIPA